MHLYNDIHGYKHVTLTCRLKRYDIRYLWCPREADFSLPAEAHETCKRLEASYADVLVICNDYDYVLHKANFRIAFMDQKLSTRQCWHAVPDELFAALNIDDDNRVWIGVLVNNDYSRRGLRGVGWNAALDALCGQPALSLENVLQRPSISRKLDAWDDDARQAACAYLEATLLEFGAHPVLVQRALDKYELVVPLHAQLSQRLRTAALREQQLLQEVDAAELANGRIVLLWDKVVHVPNDIWYALMCGAVAC
jgi:hypothetical protein